MRGVKGFLGGPHWAVRVPGTDALRVWERLRAEAALTGYWPLIIGNYGGPECGGSDEAIKSLAESAREVPELPTEELEFLGLKRTPQETLDAASACPFECWAELQRDPDFQVRDHLRKAAYFDRFPGAASIAQLHRDTAERWRNQTRWVFRPENYSVPPKDNHSPPQQELHCITYHDSASRKTVIAESVSVLLVPTPHGWEAPAYLSYTTKENERLPQVHVAALKWLHERFGAELVGLEDRVLEVVPQARPATANDALRAAALLTAYSGCTVTSENELTTIPELALYLMESPYWTFCWP